MKFSPGLAVLALFLIATSWVAALPPGSQDPEFRARFAAHESPRDVTAGRDGSVYVLLDDDDSFRHQLPLIVRFLADGTRDPNFKADPAPDWRNTKYVHRGIKAGPDGRIYVEGMRNAASGPVGDPTVQPDTHGALRRLLPTGRFDDSYNGAAGFQRVLHSYSPTAGGRVWVTGKLEGRPGMSFRCLGESGAILEEMGGLDAPKGTWFNVNSVLERSGNRLLLAGQIFWRELAPTVGFLQIGPDGQVDRGFHPPPEGFNRGYIANVWQAALDHADRILVAGLFRQVGRHATTNVARLLPDGKVDTEFRVANLNDSVQQVWEDPEGRILIQGRFGHVHLTPRPGLARLHPDGSLDSSYAPELAPGAEVLKALDAGEGRVLVLGTRIEAGERRPFLVRLLPGNAQEVSPGISWEARAVQRRVGGECSLAPVLRFPTGARLQWYRNGEILPGATNALLRFPRLRMEDNGTYQLQVDSDQGSAGSRPVAVVVQPAAASPGSPDMSVDFAGGPNDFVNAMLLRPDNKLLVGGSFQKFGEIPTGGLAVLGEDGELDLVSSHAYGMKGVVQCLIADGDGVLVAGVFPSLGGHPSSGLARLSADGTVDPRVRTKLAPGSRVDSVARLADGSLLVSGFFVTGPDLDRDGVFLARLRPDGELDTDFAPRLFPPTMKYHVRAQADGGVLVVGWAFGPTREGFVRFLRPDGSLVARQSEVRLEVFNGSPFLGSQPVGPDGMLLAGSLCLREGTNAFVNGLAEFRAGMLAPATRFPVPIVAAMEARCLLLDPAGRLVLGGGTLSRFQSGKKDTNFHAVLGGTASCLAVNARGDYYVGGRFDKVGEVLRRNLARIYGSDRTEPYLLGPFRSEQGLVLQFETNEGWNYEIEAAEDLQAGPWVTATRFQGDGKLNTLETGTLATAQRYFRVRVRP